MTPPPPSSRCHGLRTKRPAAPLCGGVEYSSSIVSKAVQMRSRKAANQVVTRAWRSAVSEGGSSIPAIN
jgi:hypothetical protein